MGWRRVREWAKATFGLQKKFNELLRLAFEKKRIIAITAALVLLTLLLFSFLKELFVMAFFIALGAVSMLYNRFIRTSIGIELITASIVIVGRLYGPAQAMMTGFLSLLLAELLSGSLQHKTIVSFAGVLAIGFLTQYFSSATITTEGIALVLIYNAIIVPGYLLLGSSPLRTGLFLLTHLMFNFWMFTTIIPSVYELIA